MEYELPDGRSVDIPDDIQGAQLSGIINGMISQKQAAPQIAPQASTTQPSWWQQPMPGDEEPGAMGVQTPTIPREPFPSTKAGPLPAGMAEQATPAQVANWESEPKDIDDLSVEEQLAGGLPFEKPGAIDPWFDPFLVGPAAGGVGARLAYKAGVKLLPSLIRGTVQGTVSGAADLPISWGTELMPKDYQLVTNLFLGVMSGKIEDRITDVLVHKVPVLSKFLGRKITDMVDEIPGIKERIVKMAGPSQIADDATNPLRSKIEQSTVTKTNREIFGDDDIPKFEDSNPLYGRVEKLTGQPLNTEEVATGRKLFGQIEKEADVKSTAGALGDNRVQTPIRLSQDRMDMGRFGAAKIKGTNEWRLFQRLGDDSVDWGVGRIPGMSTAGDALNKIRELDSVGAEIKLNGIGRHFRAIGRKNLGRAARERAHARDKLAKEVKRIQTAYKGKHTEDVYDVDMIETSEPLLKGVFGGLKKVSGVELRTIVRAAWLDLRLVRGGKVVGTEESTRRLARLDAMLDITAANPKSRGNIEEITGVINRAVAQGNVTPLQADLLRSINAETSRPLNYDLEIIGRDPDTTARSSYNPQWRIMRLDPARDGAFTYTHEFGHWGFWEVLSSSERMNAAKEIASLVKSGKMEKFIPLAAQHPGLLNSEMEIFAEMFSQFALQNVLPKGLSRGIKGGIIKVAQATKRVARRMFTKRQMPPELENYFRKILDMPDPSRQPKFAGDVKLERGALATMSEQEAVESLNKNNFLVGKPAGITDEMDQLTGAVNNVDPDVSTFAATNPMDGFEVVDPARLDPTGKVLLADWLRNLGEYDIKPAQFGSINEMTTFAKNALRPIIDPSMKPRLEELVGEEQADALVRMGNEIANSIDKRAASRGTNKLVKSEAENAEDFMKDYYSGARKGGPWWMSPIMQARVAPTVMAGAAGGIEFDREDGIPIPWMGGRTVGWNPVKALAWAGAVGTMTNLPGAVARKGLGKVSEKTWNTLEKHAPDLHNFAAQFHPTMRVDPEIYKSMSDYLRIRPAIERQFTKQIQSLKASFTHDELSMISDIIEKEGTGWMKAPERLKEQAGEIQTWLKDIRDSLIDAGIPEDKIDKLGMDYLPRAYSPKQMFKDRPTTTVQSLWRRLYGDYLYKRGLPRTFDNADPMIKDVLTALDGTKGLRQGHKVHQFNLLGSEESPRFVSESQKGLLRQMKQLPEYQETHVWEVDRWSQKNITLRRDYSKLEREMMGEQRNVAYRLSKFVKNAAHDVALGQAFKRIADTEGHVVDARNITDELEKADTIRNLNENGWKKISGDDITGTGVKKYGVLADKYVSPDVHKVMNALTNHRYQNRLWQATKNAWSGSTRLWKIGKTAFNPATHGYNWVANLHMCALDGRNPYSVIKLGARELITKGDIYQRAINAGMLDSNVLRGELDLGKFLEEINAVNQGSVIDDSVGLLGAMAKYGKRTTKNAMNKALRTYEIGDELFKAGVFAQEIARGATDTQAMEAANRLFFDYRDIPPGIAAIRDWGIMPFVSYTYKAIPVVAKSMAENPHRALGILWFYSMLNEISYGVDYGKGAKKQQEYERQNQPEYMRGNSIYPGGPQGNVRVPKKWMNKIGLGAGEGQTSFVDMAHSVPLGDLFSMSGMFGSYPFSFHPAISVMTAMTTGKDPRFWKDIVNQDPVTEQDKADNRMARAKYIVRATLPNLPFIPGSYAMEKIGNALTAEGVIKPSTADKAGWTGKDYYGGDVSLAKEVTGMFGLAKFREPYPQQEYAIQMKKGIRQFGKSVSKATRAAMDQRTSQTELDQLIQNARDTGSVEREELGKLREIYNKAPDPGMTRYSQ
jgi:hypothetical protein